MEELKELIKEKESLIKNNRKGKNICFISRGCWADPEIAYKGYLFNYYDVDALVEDESSSEDWFNACVDTFYNFTECGKKLDKFSVGDTISVYKIIKF